MDIAKKIRDKGIKVTPQRRIVYSVMTRLCHCSVEEVVAEVTVEYPDITVATIYNVLDCFAENGIISRLSTPMGKLYYDINTNTHHHIITESGNIVDYDDPELTELINDYLIKHPLENYNVDKVSLQLYEKTPKHL